MSVKIGPVNKVVLLGGGRLLLALSRWCQLNGVPSIVITSPRHAKEIVCQKKSLSETLTDENVPLLTTKDIQSHEVINFVGDLNHAFSISLGAAWIFKRETIDNLFHGRLFNLHGTRLPQNRGGGGYSWQILMGNRLGFCQLHLVDGGVDTGDIVKTEEFLYPPHCRTPLDYDDICHKKNLDFIIGFIEELLAKEMIIDTHKQTEYFSSYFPRLNTRDHGWIDWSDDVLQIERFICAFDEPYEGAKCFWENHMIFLKRACVDFQDPSFHPFQSGIVYRNNGLWLSICTLGGSLIVESVLDENGCNILPRIKIGDRLFTKRENLDGRIRRVTYTPNGIKPSDDK